MLEHISLEGEHPDAGRRLGVQGRPAGRGATGCRLPVRRGGVLGRAGCR